MMKRTSIRVFAAFLLLSAGAHAAARDAGKSDNADPWSFSISGLRLYWLGVGPPGADVLLQYTGVSLFPRLDTIFEEDFCAWPTLRKSSRSRDVHRRRTFSSSVLKQRHYGESLLVDVYPSRCDSLQVHFGFSGVSPQFRFGSAFRPR